jgi:hypothetical protein
MASPVLTAPVRDPAAVGRLDSLAKLLDTAVKIPGTNVRFGLDALIGLVPGAGDLVSGLLSVYLITQAGRMGVSRTVMSRMLANVVLDVAAGSVPVAGDVFDVAWRANTRNVALLRQHLHDPAGARRESRLVVWGMAALALLAVVGGVVLSVLAFRALLDLLR